MPGFRNPALSGATGEPLSDFPIAQHSVTRLVGLFDDADISAAASGVRVETARGPSCASNPGVMPRWWFAFLATIASVALVVGCSDTASISQPNAPSASKCQTALTGVPELIPPSGSRLSASVTTTRECPWSATTEASWIQLSPPSGQGEGVLTVTVAENPVAVRRSSAILVNDTRISVAQDAAPCRFALNPGAAAVGANGGTVWSAWQP